MAKERFFKVRGYRHTIGEDKAEPFEAIIPAENRKEACSKFWWNIKEPARPLPRWVLFEVPRPSSPTAEANGLNPS